MAQKIQIYNTKRSFEVYSTDRFVFSKNNRLYSGSSFHTTYSKIINSIIFIFLIGIFSCSEPEIKLSRADRKAVDTLTNNQLDSISPILDSLCIVNKKVIIKNAVDSIVKERQKQEERLRLNVEGS